jgi:hypothetical protein
MGLDIVELVMDLEKEFALDAREPAIDLRGETVGQLYDAIARHREPTRPANARGPYSGPLWERYLAVVEESTGVPRDRLRPDAHFVKDLHLE